MLKSQSVLWALLLASAFSRPIFADEFKVDFLPSGNPLEFTFNYDLATNHFTDNNPVIWISGGGEIFDFGTDNVLATTLPGCAVGPTGDAQIFNCLIATTLTDPTVLFQWTVSKGAGYTSANQVADLLLTISDSTGSLSIDSGATLGTGLCASGFSPPCGYGGATFSGTFTVSPTPEPASAGLALAGIGLMIGISRRRALPSRVRE
jgi:hypothetical protein